MAEQTKQTNRRAVVDGREDALTFAQENRAEVAEIIANWGCSLKPDESLINAMGSEWVARRWGVEAETEAFAVACADYNQSAALVAALESVLRPALQAEIARELGLEVELARERGRWCARWCRDGRHLRVYAQRARVLRDAVRLVDWQHRRGLSRGG